MAGSAISLALLLALGQAADPPGVISGMVVNGTNQQQPLAHAEVVLRAGKSGSFSPVATTWTDAAGRFTFDSLAADGETIYLPGANRHDVHYPGPRVRLSGSRPQAQVRLVAFDAVESPSPLVARRHEINVRVETGYLEVAESLVIDNPSQTAYVGDSQGEGPPVTIRLAIPSGFETVTFEKEFFGRNFLVHGERLVSELPWPPGTRELKYSYRLPVEKRSSALTRALDLPTESVLVRVTGSKEQPVRCNLPAAPDGPEGETVFLHQGAPMKAGRQITLELGDLPVRWELQTRWLALGLLAALIAASIAFSRRNRTPPAPEARQADLRIDRQASPSGKRRRRRRSTSNTKP